ncbi:MAG: hypothetical protein OHK0023_28160 [Anaerolineae bacterium]
MMQRPAQGILSGLCVGALALAAGAGNLPLMLVALAGSVGANALYDALKRVAEAGEPNSRDLQEAIVALDSKLQTAIASFSQKNSLSDAEIRDGIATLIETLSLIERAQAEGFKQVLEAIKTAACQDAAMWERLAPQLERNFNVLRGEIDRLPERIRQQSDVPLQPELVKQCIGTLNTKLRDWQDGITVRDTKLFLERPEVDAIINWIQKPEDDNTLGVVLGGPGHGKTVILKRVLERLESLSIPVLAIKSDIENIPPNIQDFGAHLGLPGTIEQCSRALADNGLFVVLIDQLDALSASLQRDRTMLNTMFSLITQLKAISKVRVVVSCRIFDWKQDLQLRLMNFKGNKEFEVSPLAQEEVNKVLSVLGKPEFKSLSPVYQTLLSNPLNLSLFATIVQEAPDDSSEYQNLQNLYQKYWQLFIERNDNLLPPSAQRRDVIYKMVAAMHQQQRHFVLEPVLDDVSEATNYLERVGFIQRQNNRWQFMYQTLFDYCYARKFVGDNRKLSGEIFQSSQGFFQRSQMLSVLIFLRAADEAGYRSEIENLLGFNPEDSTSKLCFHLRLLLIQWLATQPKPLLVEQQILFRLSENADDWRHFLSSAHGNEAWLLILSDVIQRQLSNTPEWTIIPYLGSFMNSHTNTVLDFLEPYIGRSPEWDNSIAWCLSRIEDWRRADRAVDVLIKWVNTGQQGIWIKPCLHHLGQSYPKKAVEALRAYLDQQLRDVLIPLNTAQNNQVPIGNRDFSIWERNALGNWHVKHLVEKAVNDCPDVFLQHILPWFVAVARQFVRQPSLNHETYPSCRLFSEIDLASYSEGIGLIAGLRKSLGRIAQDATEDFHRILLDLLPVEVVNVQELVVMGFLASPETYADEIFQYLVDDKRRLNLRGSCALLANTFQYLNPEYRTQLENMLLTLAPPDRTPNGWDLIRQKQLRFLSQINLQLLSPQAIKKLGELQRLFPSFDGREYKSASVVYAVPSPIPETAQERMTVDQWLGAMRRYDESTGWDVPARSRSGGIVELSRAFAQWVKEHVDIFVQSLDRFDGTVPVPYLIAAIPKLAESKTHIHHLWQFASRIAPRIQGESRIGFCRTIMKRLDSEVPDDLLDVMTDWALNDPDPNMERSQQNIFESSAPSPDSYDHLLTLAINSVRSVAVEAVCQCALKRSTPQISRVFELLNRVVDDPIDAVRLMAIEQIGNWIELSRQTSQGIDLLEKLLFGHPNLLISPVAHRYIYWMSLYNLDRGKPYLMAMLDSNHDFVCEAGARVTCLTAFEHAELAEFADQLLTGDDPVLRRGAAIIYARNIAHPKVGSICKEKLLVLMMDADPIVQKEVGNCFQHLKNACPPFDLNDFITRFTSSLSFEQGTERLIEFFAEGIHSIRDHTLILNVIEEVLRIHGCDLVNYRTHAATLPRQIVPLLIRVYYESHDDRIQARAIALFENFLRMGDRSAADALHDLDKDWKM